MRIGLVIAAVAMAAAAFAQQAPNPRQQPGATVHIFAPEQHDFYDGHFVISANRIYMVGGLNDPEGWDHLDNEARNVKPVSADGGNRRQRDQEHRDIRSAAENS